MSEFVEECRREWRRLGVPDPVANEMAADLEADLEEAEAEGVSAEEVLGSGAFDPHSFAAAWAAERGVIQSPPSGQTHRRRSRLAARVAAIAAFALIAIIGAVLVVFASPPGSERLAVASVFPPRLGVVGPPRLRLVPSPREIGPRLRIVPPPAPGSGARIFPVAVRGSGVNLRPIGLLLMIVGIVGLIVSMLYRSQWGGRWSRPRASTGDRPA